MFSSLINACEARQLKEAATADYIKVVELIKKAAKSGQTCVEVDGALISTQVLTRLEADNFDVSVINTSGKIRIWWG